MHYRARQRIAERWLLSQLDLACTECGHRWWIWKPWAIRAVARLNEKGMR
jgi:hypothetical protein